MSLYTWLKTDLGNRLIVFARNRFLTHEMLLAGSLWFRIAYRKHIQYLQIYKTWLPEMSHKIHNYLVHKMELTYTFQVCEVIICLSNFLKVHQYYGPEDTHAMWDRNSWGIALGVPNFLLLHLCHLITFIFEITGKAQEISLIVS